MSAARAGGAITASTDDAAIGLDVDLEVGRALGGVILGTRDYIRKTVEPYMKHTGGSMSPLNAWIMLKGLETIDLRVRAQAETALKLTEALQGHAKLARVIYPGHPSHAQYDLVKAQTEQGGTVISLDLKGGQAAAFLSSGSASGSATSASNTRVRI